MHLDLIFSNPQKSNTKYKFATFEQNCVKIILNIIQIQQIQDLHGFMICVHRL